LWLPFGVRVSSLIVRVPSLMVRVSSLIVRVTSLTFVFCADVRRSFERRTIMIQQNGH